MCHLCDIIANLYAQKHEILRWYGLNLPPSHAEHKELERIDKLIK
uniref:Uncharacterized protein n=1 Tax=viral metagenome TaxID=1070528 RepID=A0A6H2A2T6_9ZZZZ